VVLNENNEILKDREIRNHIVLILKTIDDLKEERILEQNRIETAIKQASEITKYEKEIQILNSKLEKLKKSQ
jgi:coenzyme F420-reducing hydrogenase delta subunit